MKKNAFSLKYFLADPLALAVACIISLLFAQGAHQFLHTKRASGSLKEQTIVSSQLPDSPEDVPDTRDLKKFVILQKQIKNISLLHVTFNPSRDYSGRLMVRFYELSQPPAWLPSIPVAHRKLII